MIGCPIGHNSLGTKIVMQMHNHDFPIQYDQLEHETELQGLRRRRGYQLPLILDLGPCQKS